MNPSKEARINRRSFVKSTTTLGLGSVIGTGLAQAAANPPDGGTKPVVISSANGLEASAKAMGMIQAGADALDAIIAGINLVEDDPDEHYVGYGGLPNEDGVVELDASVMHGPTGRGGAVAALQNIRYPSKVAKVVMERTDHVLLAGPGALRFAKAHGFKEENLLTDEAREIWLKWKETLSNSDNWLPPHDLETRDVGMLDKPVTQQHGTINCNAVDLRGGVSGCTSTSGRPFKIAGRVGDSPIFGAGLYVDNEVGAAGSTGRGEANLLSCASLLIVEFMRQGHSPEESCLLACKRIAAQTKMKRLLDSKGRPNFDVIFYAIHRSGKYGAASIWNGAKFAINTGEKVSRLEDAAYLFKHE